MREQIRTHRDLEVFQLAFKSSMEIFQLSQKFPKEETYSLTDQVRRSSRSVCANLAEAWRKRRYEGAFVNKLSDSEAEAAETQVWLDFAHACGYLTKEDYNKLYQQYDFVLGKLVNMIRQSDQWQPPH